LSQVVVQDRLPLEVHSYHWTHGYFRIPADQVHLAHMKRQGERLAELILKWRQENPERPICLLGQSAGTGVVLIAAERLPPATVQRIILLAPAVSYKHDLRPALASACQGIDVFYSHHDWACLGLGVLLAGTTDRYWSVGAGKVGFRPIINSPEDAALYARLRQYPWDCSLSWTGHHGGHYGSYQPEFMRVFVVPLLLGTSPREPGRDEHSHGLRSVFSSANGPSGRGARRTDAFQGGEKFGHVEGFGE
jgi:hypothetical protein